MSDIRLDRTLAAYGSDFSRWPDHAGEARAALLADPQFRRAFERERALDQRLAGERAALDAEIARSGAFARLSVEAARRSADSLAGMPWRRIAAGVLLAGMLGGALDLMLAEPPADLLELAIVDPFDISGIR